ncbi:MAG: hypothetical protein AAB426_02435, partial [Myxococcota bacterium]
MQPLAVATAVCLLVASTHTRDAGRPYGSATGKLPRLNATEAALLSAAQSWAKSHDHTLVLDARLRLAAGELTDEVPGAREQA